MELRPLGTSGLKVSALALGTMNFGSDWHGTGAVDEKTAARLIDLALERGVNLIDTADIYGRGASEEMLGRLLKGRRERVLLASKVLGQMRPGDRSSGGLSARWVRRALEDSLRRLKTDRLDLYMPHGWDHEVPWEETAAALEEARAAGKVRAVGCSNFSGAQFEEAARRAPRLEFDQVQYSLAWRRPEEDLAPALARRGASLVAWSPLGGGLLTGKYGQAARPAGRRASPDAFPSLPEARLEGVVRVLRQVAELEGLTPARAALGWLLSRPGLASAVVGAREPRQLEETLGARPLSARGAAFLDKASLLCSAR